MKLLKKIALFVVSLDISGAAWADPVGMWKTFDLDNPSMATSIVKITFENGAYVGRLQKVIRPGATDNTCRVDLCKGKYAGKDMSGAPVIWGFKPAGNNQYTGGTAHDLQHDKKYQGTMTEAGNKLHLKAGYKVLGTVVGKKTTWVRVN